MHIIIVGEIQKNVSHDGVRASLFHSGYISKEKQKEYELTTADGGVVDKTFKKYRTGKWFCNFQNNF